MRKVVVIVAAAMLSACQNPDIGAYHHQAAHPFTVTETSTRLPLAAVPIGEVAQTVRAFARQAPNGGSSFIVSAPTETANEARIALIRAGIDPRDIRIVPEGDGQIIRTDRFARVDNCSPPVRQQATKSYLWEVEDGWRRSNENSQMLGCSVRRNISEMVEDPRSLVGPVMTEGRDGSRAATVHETWVQGKDPSSKIELKGVTTTDSMLGGGK